MASAMVAQLVIFWLTYRWATAIERKEEGLSVSLDMAKAWKLPGSRGKRYYKTKTPIGPV